MSVTVFYLYRRRWYIEYRGRRVSPGVAAPKLFSPTSVAGYAAPSVFLADHPQKPGTAIRGSEWGPSS